MNVKRDSNTVSPWQAVEIPVKPQKNQYDADVIIVGGGITGLTTALLLQKGGKQCLLVEAVRPGYGTTGGTTAHLNTFFDATYPEIERDFNEEAARLVAEAGKFAIDIITDLSEQYGINCDLEMKSGYLYAETDQEVKQLEEIFEASQRAGVRVERSTVNGLPVPFMQSLHFADQKQFHPMKYLSGLAKAFQELGGVVLENTFIDAVKNEKDTVIAESESGAFRASHLVYATHVPPGVNQFSFRCAPYRSYVLGLILKKESDYPESMSYDLQEPYHYFRTHIVDGEKILIVGGSDHKTGHDDPQQAFADLKKYAESYFDIKKVAYKWSSQYYVPVDGLPYIGRMNGKDDAIFVGTGYNGNGTTWGTIAGTIISDLILNKENRFAELLNPARIKPIAGFSEFVKENADVAYHFLADRFKAENLESLKDLQYNEGKLVDYEGEKLAVYKDKAGKVTALNPTCTHAGCTVQYNASEKSWDCPCHGGRFDLSGKVLCGPPREDLKAVNLG